MAKKHKHPICEANESSLFGSLTPDEFYARHSVSHSSEYITNSRGLKLFTQSWTPLPPAKPIGVLCVVHGYLSDADWFVQLTSVLFAQSGFATCAIDHQGHGFSEGLSNHIPDINPVVDDAISFFDSFRAKHPPDLPAFLYAESLGGAIALYITLRQKGAWDGLILHGAMCEISDKFKPPWLVVKILSAVGRLMDTWQVFPTRSTIPTVSYKEGWKLKLVLANPKKPKVETPRVGTALEFVRVTKDLQARFEEVEVPLLICHGEEDVICDPAGVKELYRRAASEDKTLRIYPGMWHQLIGEPEENVDLVFGEMVEWLTERASRAAARR